MNATYFTLSIFIDVIILSKMELPNHALAQQYFISPEGLQKMLATPRDPNYPGRNILWTDDISVELPIRMGTSGITSIPPTTIIEEFRRSVDKFGLRSALSSKVNGVWVNYP